MTGPIVTDCEDGRIVYQPDRDRVCLLSPAEALVMDLCIAAGLASEVPQLLGKSFPIDGLSPTSAKCCARWSNLDIDTCYRPPAGRDS